MCVYIYIYKYKYIYNLILWIYIINIYIMFWQPGSDMVHMSLWVIFFMVFNLESSLNHYVMKIARQVPNKQAVFIIITLWHWLTCLSGSSLCKLVVKSEFLTTFDKKTSFYISILHKSLFFLIYFNWRLVTLQYYGGFCHTFTWISRGCPLCVCLSHTPE